MTAVFRRKSVFVGTRFSRRTLLRGTIAGVSGAVVNAVAAPLISYASSRPMLTHGLQSGDVTCDGAVIWARTDRPARMLVEASTSDTFEIIRAGAVADAFPETDFTAKVALDGLPAGRDIFYRVQFQDHAAPTILSEPAVGSFRTAPLEARTVSFVWSGDTAGQGFGIDIARGGMRAFSTMARHTPDFFIHSGDSIYADCEIPAEVLLKNGDVWRNVVTEEKSKVAETLAEFRGNYKYNLLDANVRDFNARVPIYAQWDDHEVTNDWVPGESVTWYRYTEKSILALAARGGRAFHEFMPTRQAVTEPGRVYRKIAYGPLLDVFMIDMRSYRTSLKDGEESEILGATQLAWLKHGLMNSRATWKVIAADLPIGLVSDDAVALGDGPPRAREHEIAALLSFIKYAGVSNVVWLTADMHYTAAHYYDPNKAVFQDFEPFWEFVSGPLNAGTWSVGQLDNTFGPTAIFAKGASAEQEDCLAPCYGLQFFGHVSIDGESEAMTVTLRDVDDNALWQTIILPKGLNSKRQKFAGTHRAE